MAGIVWTVPPSVLQQELLAYEQAIYAELKKRGDALAAEAVGFMKANAPWTDRTGMARATLWAEAVQDANGSVTLFFGHGVYYGLYLEVRWGGKYQILETTSQVYSSRWEQELQEMFGTLT